MDAACASEPTVDLGTDIFLQHRCAALLRFLDGAPLNLIQILIAMASTPNCEHSTQSIMAAVGATVASRLADGRPNPKYQVFQYRLKSARSFIEARAGRRFVRKVRGRGRVYTLEEAPM